MSHSQQFHNMFLRVTDERIFVAQNNKVKIKIFYKHFQFYVMFSDEFKNTEI